MKNALVYPMLLVLASLVAAQTDKLKSEPGLKETPKQEYIPIGSLQGKIEGPAKDGKIRVALTLPFAEIDNDVREQSEKMRRNLIELRKQALALPKDSPDRAKKASELETGMADLQTLREKMVTSYQPGDTLELSLQPLTAIRLSTPPGGLFDEKGNIRKYSTSDLQKLRGPGKLPGFTGDMDSLKSGRLALVSVFKKKPPAKKDNLPPDPGKNDLYAGMILILDAE